ncbi:MULTISPECIES: DddA-like double-stranded DNA deaminase toxin [Actinosynnema]|uniref:DddA-like double-stranded DNA deaminase toxin n=1 Tax=Actinosynnema TaxID=40566 RepID=UPI0020A4EC86|nr:DddA-like double-stranded DNA deaminase toxin [Actinosynnema pretiosum]MCP2093602.1 SCP1.201-like deaminase [Actinosynnema pretiosum]
MASLEDVGTALSNVLAQVTETRTLLVQAGDLAEEAAELVSAAGTGTLQSDVELTTVSFLEAANGIFDRAGLIAALDRAEETTYKIMVTLGLTSTAAPPAQTAPTPSHQDRLKALRGELPPAVVANTGSKTHGRWFTPHGETHEIISGDDPGARAALQAIRDEGWSGFGRPIVVMHVELKLATHMRNAGIEHATLVINNVPGKLTLSCESLIGVVLPAGSSLTIYGIDGYQRTFTGGQRAPW